MTHREKPNFEFMYPVYFCSSKLFSTPLSLYYTIDPLRPPVGLAGLHSGFRALITTRTSCPAQPPEAGREIMAPAERSLVPPTGHGLIPHHQPIHPWPPLPASFAKYSFYCVQVVAGGGGGVVRSRYSQKGWSVERGAEGRRGERGGAPSESICTQRDGSLWSPRLHLPR